MSDSIFSKIIRGEIPANRVYEDEHCIAILDIGPLSEGHTLVIPKEPAETLGRLSDGAAAAVGKVLPRICRAVMEATGATDYNILQNNGQAAMQSVPHVHFHIIPKFPDRNPGGGLGMKWDATTPDAEETAALGRRIARLL